MRLPSSRIGWALMPGALVLGLSGLAVAGQSGLFTGALEDEAREYAIVVWGVASALIVSSTAIILVNIMKRGAPGDSHALLPYTLLTGRRKNHDLGYYHKDSLLCSYRNRTKSF